MSAHKTARISVDLEYVFHNPDHPLFRIWDGLPENLKTEVLLGVLDNVLESVNEGGTWVTLRHVSTSADGASPETTLTAR